jgi:hypothetical protein
MRNTLLLNTAALAMLATMTAANAQSSQDRNRAPLPPNASQNSQQPRDNGETDRRASSQAAPSSPSSAGATGEGTSSSHGSAANSDTSSSSAQNATPPSSGNAQQKPNAADTKSSGASSGSDTRQSANPSNSSTPSNANASLPAANQSEPANAQNSQQPQSAPDSRRNAAASSNQTNTSGSLNEQQTKSISTAIAREKVNPVTNVNFSISIGTAVPRTVRLQPLSAEINSIVPQYRGYNYFVTRDQIVIVEPTSYKIVTVLPYTASGSASIAPAARQRATKFSQQERDVIRKQMPSRPMRSPSTTTREMTIGEEVPSSVTVEEFPETVYREVPEVRSYRYYRTDRNVVVIDPDRRTVVDVIE